MRMREYRFALSSNAQPERLQTHGVVYPMRAQNTLARLVPVRIATMPRATVAQCTAQHLAGPVQNTPSRIEEPLVRTEHHVDALITCVAVDHLDVPCPTRPPDC